MRVLPALVTLAVMLCGIQRSSYIPDEASTLSAVQRPFPELLRTLGNTDAVHGAYYALIWVQVRLAGSGELATRLPSALAMAAAAVGVAALGRRLVSPRAGLAAGFVFASLPLVSQFGQDARPYAMVTALATLASYLLIRALDAEPGQRRDWLVAYAACLAVLGLMEIFALLLIVAHAVPVGLRCWPGGGEADRRSLAWGWLAAAVAGIAGAGPAIALGWEQRGTLESVKLYGPGPASLTKLIGSPVMVVAVGVTLACGIAVSAWADGLRASRPGRLAALCVPWLIFPPALLLGVSLISPVYTVRYILFCVPAIALLAGAALAALGRVAGTAALALTVIFAVPAQLQQRSPGGQGIDLRQADQIIAAHRQPGDAVLFSKPVQQSLVFGYPYGLASLNDIGLAQTPAEAGNLTGTLVQSQALHSRLAEVSRVWCFARENSRFPPALHGLGFQPAGVWYTSGIWLHLYTRRPERPGRSRPSAVTGPQQTPDCGQHLARHGPQGDRDPGRQKGSSTRSERGALTARHSKITVSADGTGLLSGRRAAADPDAAGDGPGPRSGRGAGTVAARPGPCTARER